MFCANAANCPKRLTLPEGADLDELRLGFEEIVRDNAGDDPVRERAWLARAFQEWHGGTAPSPAEGLRQRVFALWVARVVGTRPRHRPGTLAASA